ncbi:MAG: PEP-CTERM sorting domain-containing protein, partial [Planctomycetaceae bacterium]
YLYDLPPYVVYMHEKSTLVNVSFADDAPSGLPIPADWRWIDGEVFGTVQLAGHGVGFNSSSDDDAQRFGNLLSIPEPGSVSLLGMALAAMLGFNTMRGRPGDRRRRTGSESAAPTRARF